MKTTPIRSTVEKTKQCRPEDLGRESFVYVDISSIDRETKQITDPQTLWVSDAPSRARKAIEARDVLVSTVRPNLNAVAQVPKKYAGEIASTGFCVLRPNRERIESKYLFYFVQSRQLVDHLTRLSIGAGYPAVSDADIFDAEIPLPPLPEQQRITAILAKADRLRRLRRFALALSDGYLQAVFLEMFGDPVANPMGWEQRKLEKHITFLTSGSRGWAKYYAESGDRFIRSLDVNTFAKNEIALDSAQWWGYRIGLPPVFDPIALLSVILRRNVGRIFDRFRKTHLYQILAKVLGCTNELHLF